METVLGTSLEHNITHMTITYDPRAEGSLFSGIQAVNNDLNIEYKLTVGNDATT